MERAQSSENRAEQVYVAKDDPSQWGGMAFAAFATSSVDAAVRTANAIGGRARENWVDECIAELEVKLVMERSALFRGVYVGTERRTDESQ